jgi:nucleoside-diphosphate-sugar epimerase
MPHTLVTGANSFVAAHVINTLIAEGHTVTGSVRRATAGEIVLAEHPEWSRKLDFVEIKDYAEAGIWNDVFKSRAFDHIVHVAAPLLDNPANTDYDRDFLRPSVEGYGSSHRLNDHTNEHHRNLSLLRSAQKYAPSLKSIAVTGSINAITTGDDLTTRRLTNESWNTVTKEQARELNNAYISYCSAKKESEEAIWSFVKSENPSFAVTVFLPALIFGPPIQGVKSTKTFNFSAGIFFSLFSGENAGKPVPSTAFPSYIDVRDLAIAHVKALIEPNARNKRFLIGGEAYSNTAAVHVLRAKFPELAEKLPIEDEKAVVVPQIGAAEGNETLELQFRSFEATVEDMTRKILEIQKLEN